MKTRHDRLTIRPFEGRAVALVEAAPPAPRDEADARPWHAPGLRRRLLGHAVHERRVDARVEREDVAVALRERELLLRRLVEEDEGALCAQRQAHGEVLARAAGGVVRVGVVVERLPRRVVDVEVQAGGEDVDVEVLGEGGDEGLEQGGKGGLFPFHVAAPIHNL